MRRRGKLHIFDRLDGAKSALVVIDMQNFFMKPGMAAEVPTAREIVPNINRLAGAFQKAGGTVVWIQMTHPPEDKESWSVFYNYVHTPESGAQSLKELVEGSEGHRFWPELDVKDGDLTIRKNRFSAFLPGSSDLAERLWERGVDTVVITGTLTSVCCESSARDAMMRNFKTIMVSDANAAMTDEDHQAALTSFYQAFGDVYSTDEVIELLADGAEGSEAAE